ncbi:MAG: CRISPR-associated endonuclease Cas2 [Candidatus Sungbacteria bacterium]|nr:CRISPR-associated endonuclease Cas2 [Candidatus Sungbacteria bacterium]
MATFTENILDYLQMQAENTVDLFAMFSLDRRKAMKEARRSIIHGPRQFKVRWADAYHEHQRFYALMNRLKRDGLVTKRKTGHCSVWDITAHGEEHLAHLKDRSGISKHMYVKQETGSLVIISFDVPERERRKRTWLRTNLVALGFTMLQQSVWLGKVKIPKEFMMDLRTQKMLSWVHIFSVNKFGTIVQKKL